MRINSKIRKLVCKRKIKALSKKLNQCNPYGYEYCQKIYEDLSYYEDMLYKLKNTSGFNFFCYL